MKILKEEKGKPTVIELAIDESVIVFSADGRYQALLAMNEDEHYVNEGCTEATVAIIALTDKTLHDVIYKRIDDNKGN